MTLAVGANLERLVRRDRRFLLLMTDSRFTYASGSHRDDGAKMWKLAANIGAVFAGDVEIGEKSLALVQSSIGSVDRITFDVIVASFKDGVDRFYRRSRPTSFVLGAVSAAGEARMFFVDHKLGPVPREETGKFLTIGHPDALAAFVTELGEIPEGPLHQLGADPLAEFHLHALPYVSTFARALVRGGETVGFPMQIMLVTEFGEETLHLTSMESADTPRFEKLSAGPGEVRSLCRDPERRQYSHRMRIRLQQFEDQSPSRRSGK